MRIGIATDNNTEEAKVSETLEGSGFLIIVETETMHAEEIVPNAGGGSNYPEALERHSCEAIVCGTIQQELFEPIAAKQITRYNGYGLSIGEAAEAAHYDILPLIVIYEGGKPCRDDDPHDESFCEGHEHA